MTSKERQLFISEFKKRRSSRLTHLSSGHTLEFGDGAFAGQVIDGSIDGSWEPITDGDELPLQGHENPEGESIPTGQRRADDDGEIQKARVNRDGQTRSPLKVQGDSRNTTNKTVIDISQLTGSPKVLVLDIIRKYPDLFEIGSRPEP